jgi:immunity protein 53 of polymorphic toxin system
VVKLETIDNPGWSLVVDVEDTEIEGRLAEWGQIDQSEPDWMGWKCDGRKFYAACGRGGRWPENAERLPTTR